LLARSSRCCVFVLAMACACFSISNASAQSIFESMVMPGPLIEGHAKLEKECKNCHVPYERQAQAGLCLGCHDKVAADRTQKRGMHGRDTATATTDCKKCHADHKGRSFAAAAFDTETFNHGVTNFALMGAHAAVRCDGCHKADAKYRAAPSACVDCHGPSEPHKGRLGKACETCHTVDIWRKTKPFDHSKTSFALEGAHREVVCLSCHAAQVYKGAGTTCVACHGLEDKHETRYGAKCETCHGPSKWAKISFDHAKATKFPLRGKHGTVKCDSCHSGDLYRDKLATNCVACHQKDDVHKGQMGVRCEQCHNEAGWRQKVVFDHDVTRFPLVGAHTRVACEGCHKSRQFKNTPQACNACHNDTRHEGRLGPQCGHCHTPVGWKRWKFDHAKQTRYPLTGAHQGLQCHACHTAKVDGKISLSTTCISCHAADDIHRGGFGSSCEQCHDTTSFRRQGLRR
jgi:hypothetical protein